MKKPLIGLFVLTAICLLTAPAALALEGAEPCLVLSPSGGPSIRVEVDGLCESSSVTGNISWELNGVQYSFNVTGTGQGWTENDDVHCKLNLHGSDKSTNGVSMFVAVIQVNGARTNTASITWNDVSYDISLVYFKGNEEDQEYTGSGPIVSCE